MEKHFCIGTRNARNVQKLNGLFLFIALKRMEAFWKKARGMLSVWALRACSYKTKTEASQQRRSRHTLQGVFLVFVFALCLFISLSLWLFLSLTLCLFVALSFPLVCMMFLLYFCNWLECAHAFWRNRWRTHIRSFPVATWENSHWLRTLDKPMNGWTS